VAKLKWQKATGRGMPDLPK